MKTNSEQMQNKTPRPTDKRSRRDRIDDWVSRRGIIVPGYSAVLVNHYRQPILSALTGIEHLEHATLERNVPSILEKGFLTEKSLAPDTYTSRFLGNNGVSQHRVFMARHHDAAQAVAKNLKKIFGEKARILKVRIPYDELRDLGYTKYNPEYIQRARDLYGGTEGYVRTLRRLVAQGLLGPGIGSAGTRVFKHDIPPEYIKGSANFSNGIGKMLRNFPRYVRRHPSRFLVGSAFATYGAASASVFLRNVLRHVEKRRRDDFLRNPDKKLR